jgi:DNA gyrase/topoisomerase IV subunit A
MHSLLEKARDESDRTHPVRLVFEPRSSRVGEDEFVKLLLAKTSMETNASINLVMVGLDGRPMGKNLKSVLAEWLEFRFRTVKRRTRFPSTAPHQWPSVLNSEPTMKPSASSRNEAMLAAVTPEPR